MTQVEEMIASAFAILERPHSASPNARKNYAKLERLMLSPFLIYLSVIFGKIKCYLEFDLT